MAVVKGERFRVLEDHAIAGLSRWRAPFTGLFECTLPAGLLLVCRNEQKPGAVGISCVPEDYESGERLLVPKEDREHPKYDSYYFVLMDGDRYLVRARRVTRFQVPRRTFGHAAEATISSRPFRSMCVYAAAPWRIDYRGVRASSGDWRGTPRRQGGEVPDARAGGLAAHHP